MNEENKEFTSTISITSQTKQITLISESGHFLRIEKRKATRRDAESPDFKKPEGEVYGIYAEEVFRGLTVYQNDRTVCDLSPIGLPITIVQGWFQNPGDIEIKKNLIMPPLRFRPATEHEQSHFILLQILSTLDLLNNKNAVLVSLVKMVQSGYINTKDLEDVIHDANVIEEDNQHSGDRGFLREIFHDYSKLKLNLKH